MSLITTITKIFFPRYIILAATFFGVYYFASLAGNPFESRWNPLIENVFTFIILNLAASIIVGYISIRAFIQKKHRLFEGIFMLSLVPIILATSVVFPVATLISGGTTLPKPFSINCANNKIYFLAGSNGQGSIFLDQGLKMISLGSITKDITTNNYLNPEFNDKATQELKDCVNKAAEIN